MKSVTHVLTCTGAVQQLGAGGAVQQLGARNDGPLATHHPRCYPLLTPRRTHHDVHYEIAGSPDRRIAGSPLWAQLALAVVTLSLSTTALASDPETIYLQRVTVAPDGSRSYYAEGGATVTLRDGSEHSVDHDTLEDPDGNRYGIEADIYQLAEGADVIYEYRLVRHDPIPMTEEDLREAMAIEALGDTGLDDTGSVPTLSAGSDGARSAMLGTHEALILDRALEDWADIAGRGETVEVHVILAEGPALDLPDVTPNLADSDPVYYLDQMADRLLAVEDRKTEMGDLYQRFLAEHGVRDFYAYWLINGARLEVDLETLTSLAADERVARLEIVSEGEPESNNNGDAIMDATGISAFLNDGHDGELPSGRSSVNDIYIGLIDNYLWTDHYAWEDCADPGECMDECDFLTCPDRLVSALRWLNTHHTWVPNTIPPTQPKASHCTHVAGMMVADLTDGQDPSITNHIDQRDYSGLSTESAFSFISYEHGAGKVRAIQKAVALDVDIANMSAGADTADLCGQSHATIDAVNAAALHGVFFVKSAGNHRHDQNSNCYVSKPGTAAGSFTVGALEVRNQASLSSAPIWQSGVSHPVTDKGGSSRGGDAHGRSVIALAVPGGKENARLTGCDLASDTGLVCVSPDYEEGGVNTSQAAGAMSGAAANFKSWMVDMYFPWPTAWTDENTVGLMHAALLLQGDGVREGGTTAPPYEKFDSLYGAGRLAARTFDDAGMTPPYRFRFATRIVEDSEGAAPIYLNPDGDGNNQVLPVEADTIKAAVWWYEPNLFQGDPPKLLTRLNGEDNYSHWNIHDTKQRVGVVPPNPVGGYTWSINLFGTELPESTDVNYFYGQERRKVFVAMYWENQQ
jgi:hypothetical protein